MSESRQIVLIYFLKPLLKHTHPLQENAFFGMIKKMESRHAASRNDCRRLIARLRRGWLIYCPEE